MFMFLERIFGEVNSIIRLKCFYCWSTHVFGYSRKYSSKFSVTMVMSILAWHFIVTTFSSITIKLATLMFFRHYTVT